MLLRYTLSGHVFITPEDDLDMLVDELISTGYDEEFCIATDISPDFIARLMKAGFLVMSVDTQNGVLLLPKIHLTRSVLLFPELHVKKSIKRFLGRYELRVDTDFNHILDRCIEVHGNGWLTLPLTRCIKWLHHTHASMARPLSFGVYRNGKLRAGEFGVVSGRVYTSYSGYYNEPNAGTCQLVLTTRYLQNTGFAFFDLGMPLPYKDDLGAQNIDTQSFVALFRQSR
ncbi:MAG: GNAT family N-acetyltransferase [Treponema sp.]|jgi:Leu/Phe-tRNA-protein transferase|nr:GNAT family N-acetyltransferase [Treponema sp.]